MKIAIMQPYIFPYIGYFQLIAAVDKFVLYDNIKYTKKGWINRNRILVNFKDEYLSIPLKKDSDFLNINQRFIAESYITEKEKLCRKIEACYKKAPEFNTVFPLVTDVIMQKEENLFSFIHYATIKICEFLGIATEIVVSSTIDIDHNLKSEEKVIAICKSLNSTEYINPIGGVELYDKTNFAKHNISLHFLKSRNVQYQQFNNSFIPWLSIIDVMMFNSKRDIALLLQQYDLE